MSEALSYSVGSPDSATEMLAVAERIARQKRLGTDPVQNVDGSGKPIPGSALDILTRLREKTLDSQALLTQPPGKWHIRGLIKEGQFGLMLGKWKGGKTLAAIHCAHCVSLNLPWTPPPNKLSRPFGEVVKAGNVLYVASEGGGALRNRVDAWQRTHDPDGSVRAASPYKIFWFTERVNLLDAAHVEALKTFCRERDICFVIVDTLASSINGADARGGNPENDNALMTALMENAASIAAHVQGAGFFIAHPGKSDNVADKTRGAGAIEASARFKLLVGEKNNTRHVTLDFNNEANAEGMETFFAIESVQVGEDEQGEAIHAPVYKPAVGEYVAPTSPQELEALRGILPAMDDEDRIDRATMLEVFSSLRIKAPRSVLNRLLACAWLAGVGPRNSRKTFDHYTVTEAGRNRAAITLGESRLPADQRRTAAEKAAERMAARNGHAEVMS